MDNPWEIMSGDQLKTVREIAIRANLTMESVWLALYYHYELYLEGMTESLGGGVGNGP
jgi:hypothetical protein